MKMVMMPAGLVKSCTHRHNPFSGLDGVVVLWRWKKQTAVESF